MTSINGNEHVDTYAFVRNRQFLSLNFPHAIADVVRTEITMESKTVKTSSQEREYNRKSFWSYKKCFSRPVQMLYNFWQGSIPESIKASKKQ